jgi:periplasmic divalent cation tolerance protein
MIDQPILVLITVPSQEVARSISAALLEQKLAACVNVLPGIRSFYTWKGAAQEDEEVLLLVKTRAALFQERLVPAVKAIHLYELPEIIAVPIQMGLPGYLNWINAETQNREE